MADGDRVERTGRPRRGEFSAERSMIKRLMAAFLMLSGLSAPPAAQTAAPAPSGAASFLDPLNGLSIEEAIARARAQEPSIRAARTSVEVARGMQVQAGLRPNPSLSLELRGQPAGSDNQTAISVEWPLDLFRREGRTSVAEREVAVAELSTADRERLLASEVRMRFGAVLGAVRDLTLLEDIVEASRRQYELLRSRVEEGASPPLDRDLVDVEVRRLD